MKIFGAIILATLGALSGLSGQCLSAEATTQPADTLWVIPHTHWEGAVFKTREEYLQIGFSHITHALQLLQKYPHYTFVLDQAAYVRPYIERFPEQAPLFKKFVNEGRLQLVLGMDVMPDDSKPGGESFIRQIQYGKGYYRKEFGKDVTIGWMLDTFGHHGQIPQLFKLAGYTSFWFFRGVPRQDFPSEFAWEGIDGTQIPAFWEPYGYGDFYGAPGTLDKFEQFAKRRFSALNANAKGHDRVVYAGADVTDPQDSLPVMMQQAAEGKRLPFNIRFGVPTEFEAAVLKRGDLPLLKGDLNPIFQGTYSSRIELKQWMRTDQRALTTAEKLAAIGQSLGLATDPDEFWKAWEPVLFNETHDLASGVMTDHVYDDTIRNYQFAESMGNHLIDRGWDHLAKSIDTRGEGDTFVVFNTLSWPRTDVAELTLAFAEAGIKAVRVTDDEGRDVPVQILAADRDRGGGIREAHLAVLAKDIPSLGYRVFHAAPLTEQPQATATVIGDAVDLENDALHAVVDSHTGAITSIKLKAGDWEALSTPANVIFRQEDHGDVWETYHGLDGGSRIAMTAKQPLPKRGSDVFSDEERAKPGTLVTGPVFSEFTIAHPFGGGKFSTTIRLVNGSSRVEVSTKLVNQSKFVRYQAMFPTSIASGHQTQSIPFGAMQRPEGIEFPAQDWTDWADNTHGVALLNVGLPGNLAANGTMYLSLLRSHTLGAYGFGGGYEPGMSSDGGLELGVERTLQYALQPHAGDWRSAKVWQSGMELGNPLLVRKSASHEGPLPTKWSFVAVSNPNVVISAVTPGRDGMTVVRVYEAAGQPATAVTLTAAAPISNAAEVNLMEDHLLDLTADGRAIRFDLKPFQIRTFAIKLNALQRQ